MAIKKSSKTKKAKPQSHVKASAVTQRPTYAELRQQLAESLERESATASQNEQLRSHQTATAEVLGIISRSTTDVQPVLDAIVESAAKVCGIDDVVLRLRDGDGLLVRSHFGHIPI